MKNAASLFIFLSLTSALLIAGDVKTKVITSASPFTTNVPDHFHLRIFNFTQEGGTTRGVVIASAATPTPAPTATATPILTPSPTATPPTPTPSPTSTSTPTPTPTPSPAPTPTPPPRGVLIATLIDPESSPEFIKQVVIDGPAQMTATCPDPSATCVITYQKEFEPTPTPTPSTIVTTGTATPTPTPTPTA